MLAATHLRSRPHLRPSRSRLGRRLLRPIRAARHAILGVAGLWAATAWGSDSQGPAAKDHAPIESGNNPSGAPVSHVVVLGDSISSGTGAERRELSYASLLVKNDDERYPDDRGSDLRHLFGPNVRYINLARDGDTTYDVLARQLPKLFEILAGEAIAGVGGSYHTDSGFVLPGRIVLVFTAGGNDFQRGIRPNPNFTGSALSRSLVNLSSIIDAFGDKAMFPGGAQAYFGNIYDVTDGEDQLNACMRGMAFPGMSDALEVWSQQYSNLAHSQRARLVDMLGLFRGHGFNFDNPHNPFHDPGDTTLWVYDRDCIHPNNLGHHMLRRAFFQQIESDFDH